MLIHPVSDLHLDLSMDWWPIGEATKADTIVLAGDTITTQVGSGKCFGHIGRIPQKLSYKHHLAIAGNHEYYGTVFPEGTLLTRQKMEKAGFTFLHMESLVIDGVRFLGCTLWSMIPPDLHVYCRDRINDYHHIFRSDGRTLWPNDSNTMFLEQLDWLTKELGKSFDGPTVVVTHNHPTFIGVGKDPDYDCSLDCCFATDLSKLVLEFQPVLWICGHIHTACDYMVGKTRVVCNPRGYPRDKSGFNNELVVEV